MLVLASSSFRTVILLLCLIEVAYADTDAAVGVVDPSKCDLNCFPNGKCVEKCFGDNDNRCVWECQCDDNFTGEDCSTPYEQCLGPIQDHPDQASMCYNGGTCERVFRQLQEGEGDGGDAALQPGVAGMEPIDDPDNGLDPDYQPGVAGMQQPDDLDAELDPDYQPGVAGMQPVDDPDNGIDADYQPGVAGMQPVDDLAELDADYQPGVAGMQPDDDPDDGIDTVTEDADIELHDRDNATAPRAIYRCNCENAYGSAGMYNGFQCEYPAQVSCEYGVEFSSFAYCVNDGTCRRSVVRGEDHVPCDCGGGDFEGRHCQYQTGTAPRAELKFVEEALRKEMERQSGIGGEYSARQTFLLTFVILIFIASLVFCAFRTYTRFCRSYQYSGNGDLMITNQNDFAVDDYVEDVQGVVSNTKEINDPTHNDESSEDDDYQEGLI